MFFGREDQLAQLEALWDKRVSSLVTCRGRRRVGKSTLVEEFAKRSGARLIKIEGIRPGSKTTVRDNYARFYLKYIEPQKSVIDDGVFEFSSLREFEGLDTIMGLAFENLVVNNFRELVPHLHLDGSLIMSAGPYRRQGTSGKNGRKGCQIDLLIQTRRALYFVEVKRQSEIGRDAIDQVDGQVCAISRPRGISAKTALVYDGHLSPVAAADGYFDAIVPFSRLLGQNHD